MCDRIVRAFSRSGSTRTVALDLSEAFDRVCYAGLLHTLKSYGVSGQIFVLICSFLSNRRLWAVLDGKSLQEHLANAGVPQGSIHGPTLSTIHINDLPDDVICDIAIYTDGTTICSKCDQSSELESDLQHTVDWAGKGLLISVLEKLK